MSKINLDNVVALVRLAGIPAYVEQTGGGCATIFAGATRQEEGYGTRHAVAAGPGWFEGPAWTAGRADSDDLFVGLDDDGTATPVDCREVGATTDAHVAALIVAAALVNAQHAA